MYILRRFQFWVFTANCPPHQLASDIVSPPSFPLLSEAFQCQNWWKGLVTTEHLNGVYLNIHLKANDLSKSWGGGGREDDWETNWGLIQQWIRCPSVWHKYVSMEAKILKIPCSVAMPVLRVCIVTADYIQPCVLLPLGKIEINKAKQYVISISI